MGFTLLGKPVLKSGRCAEDVKKTNPASSTISKLRLL
jgi:hypothetical protein